VPIRIRDGARGGFFQRLEEGVGGLVVQVVGVVDDRHLALPRGGLEAEVEARGRGSA